MADQLPIHVPESNLGEQLAVLLRQLGLAVLPLLTFYGLAEEHVVMMWLSAVGTVLTLVWGQIVSVRRLNALRTLADAVPDSIAVVDRRGS